MRAVVCHEYGPPESLRIDEVPTPSPGPGEVLVKVAFAAVNYPDVLIIADEYQMSAPLPFTPGSEFAGVVVDTGDGVGVTVGERVFGTLFVGAFADHIVVPATSLRVVPAGVPLEHATGFWVAHATAYHSLRSIAEVQPGEWVVVLGAAGGVGLAAVEIATHLGAKVIAAASSPEKLELCRTRGAIATIDYTTVDLRDGIRAAAGGDADVVIDPVGGSFTERALRATRWGGRYVTIGFASGEVPRVALNLVLLKGAIVRGFEFGGFARAAPDLLRRDSEELMQLFAEGRLSPHISSVHPIEQAAAALREVADRRSTGKVLIAC